MSQSSTTNGSNAAGRPMQPARRTGHVAATYKNCMLVWGGYNETAQDPISRYLPSYELWLYEPLFEKWFQKKCSGTLPPGTSGAAAVVVNDSFYIFGGYRDDGNTNCLYRLDLLTMEWEQVFPCGFPPTPCDKMVGWEHDGKVYFFGGFGVVPSYSPARQSDFCFVLDPTTSWSYRRGWSNQFVMYDPDSNEWKWPKYKGKAPVARAAHAAAKVGSKVYIFGGRHQNTRMNDIHCLNLETMTWSGSISTNEPRPEGRSWHSLSAVTDEDLILYGGYSQDSDPLSDCWRLHLPTLTWTELKLPFTESRLWHTACLSQDRELLLFGGCTESNVNFSIVPARAGEIIILRFSPKSLFRLCLDYVLQQGSALQPYWSSLPCTIETVLKMRAIERGTSYAGS